jgi:hypothetical protein
MTRLGLGAALAVAGFSVATFVVYHGHPTPGAVFLTLGWMALLATGYFLVRAASFDLGVGLDGAAAVGRTDELEREKRVLLKAIKECEFDRDTGKLDDGEAAAAIRRYRARAVAILRALDERPAPSVEADIEAELARRLAQAGPRACPTCALENDDDAAFCKKCGAKLEAG